MAFSRPIPDGKITVSTTTTKKRDVPTARRQCSSLQCRYDPMSYSLNFDGGACGTLPDDEDYYFRFYAFSSRYVTANTIKKIPPFLREPLSTSLHEFV
ncbi:hypothetical protein Bca4012_007404 [Brassica carinata]